MIEVNDTKLQALFARLIEAGRSPSSWLGAVANAVKEQTRLRFVDSTAPDGSKWAPVKRGGQPLRDTGTHLMNRLTAVLQGDSAVVGVPFAWAKVHQFGATISAKSAPWLRFKVAGRWASKKSVRIPARPMFGINASDRAEIAGIIRRKLAGA